MGWNEFDDKHRKQVDKYFVSCEGPYERQIIKRLLKEEFPFLTDATIDIAIEHCCKTVYPPRPRNVFIGCLRERLGL
ncbi:MAG: hypothetical protein WBD36_08210 [Bacteroidota bacterium]